MTLRNRITPLARCLVAASTLGGMSLLAPAATAHAAPAAPPSCKSNFSIEGKSYNYNQQILSFRVVGTDLEPWLGDPNQGEGLGSADVSVSDDQGTTTNTFSASSQSGMRTRKLSAAVASATNNPVLVDVDLKNESGTVVCYAYLQTQI